MIEKNQFYFWVVTGPFGIYGTPFQTYGTALRYVCDDAQSTEIIESELCHYIPGREVKITFNDNNKVYIIKRLLFTYDRNEPLVTPEDINAVERTNEPILKEIHIV